jgi:hypothetical protein
MATRVTTTFNDGSDAGLRLTLLDSDGDAALAGAISAITYTLSDITGNVLSDLEDEAITPANPVTIPLSAADMTESGTTPFGRRLLTVTWTYTDALLGSGTVHTEEYLLTINNFVNV